MTINDNDSQQTLTGNDGVITIAQLNRDVHINEQGEAVDSQGNSTANTIAPIFDADKVAKEIEAHVKITQEFGQQASQVINSYAKSQMNELRARYEESDLEKKRALQAEVDKLRFETHVLNVIVGAVTGLGGSAVTRESLAAASEEMRKITIENSRLTPEVIDDSGDGDSFILSNTSGKSVGGKWDLDPTKTGGTRIDLDGLCGSHNERCITQRDPITGSPVLDENNIPELALQDGRIQWNREGANNQSLSDWLKTDEGRKMAGAFGDIQGIKGSIFGISYKSGSWQDHLVEAFGGSHDFIGGQISGLYDEQGNAKRGMTEVEAKSYGAWSAVALAPSAPFAAATLLPSEVWKAISIMLESTK